MAPPISGMKLTFADEFNALNLYSSWKPHDQWGNRYLAGNNELQIYVDPKYKGLGINPFSVNNGVLNIKSAKAGSNAWKLGDRQYTSGMLSSHGAGGFSQQYGYFEIRAQLPQGKGMWPAFWLLADHGKWPPELDVVESIGSVKNYAVQSIHSKDGNKGKTTYTSTNLQSGFHTYGMNWSKETVSYYIDGKQTVSYKTPSDMHSKMHMLLNTAVGGNWPGSPDATTDWSKTNFKIDYVRVYSSSPNAKAVTTATNGAGTPPGSTGDVVLSNRMNSSDLSDSYRAAATGANTTRTYSAGQMAINGVKSPATATVSYNANKDITVTNNGAWNAIKNATITSNAVGNVTLRNFVSTEIKLNDKARVINVSDAKRGNIVTGAGSDTITVAARSSLASLNTMKIDAGDGNNTVKFSSPSNSQTAITTGSGSDKITISGEAGGSLKAGGGNDRINVRTRNGVTVTGGTGRDVFSFVANAHATITDYTWADDRIELAGVRASDVRVRNSGGSTYINIGNSGLITVAGATHTQNGLHLSFV